MKGRASRRELVEHLADLSLTEPAGHGPEGLCQRAVLPVGRLQHAGAGLHAKRGGVDFVERPEVRGEPGLKGKARQQRLAEGMDGLDADAPRALQHLDQQFAGGFGRGLRVLRRVTHQFRDPLFDGVVVGRRPLGQVREQPVLHFGRRRPREGDGDDVLRRHAVQQQAEEPIGQDLGLPGAGVGRDPGRMSGSEASCWRCRASSTWRSLVGSLRPARVHSWVRASVA